MVRIEYGLTTVGIDEDAYRQMWPRKRQSYAEWRSELSDFDIEFWTFGREVSFIEGSQQCKIPAGVGLVSFLGRFRNDTRGWTGENLCVYIDGTYVENALRIEPMDTRNDASLFRLIYEETGKPDQLLLEGAALAGLAEAAAETYERLLNEISRDHPWTQTHAGYNQLIARLEESPGP